MSSAWPNDKSTDSNESPEELKKEENFYDILKVDRGSTVAEIVNAYHAAKNAFSKDSVATYSLFNPEEVQDVLSRLEEAYLTLSNLEKRSEYDKKLDRGHGGSGMDSSVNHLSVARAEERNDVTKRSSGDGAIPISFSPEDMSGSFLKQIRERRSLSVEDVARITKIPSKFLQAIENDDLKRMPARVYIQGFVKNLAALYKLDTSVAAKAYLVYLDKLSIPAP